MPHGLSVCPSFMWASAEGLAAFRSCVCADLKAVSLESAVRCMLALYLLYHLYVAYPYIKCIMCTRAVHHMHTRYE